MRNKVAKRLRAEARSKTVGAADCDYNVLTSKSKNPNYGMAYQMTLNPTCTRAVYKELKKGYMRG